MDQSHFVRPQQPAVAVAGLMLALMLSGCVVTPYHHPRPAPPPPPIEHPAAQPTMYFYPEQSQGEARQDRDRYECYRWAVRETGIDPGMTPVRTPPPPRAAVRDGTEVAVGAATGAAMGAIASSSRHTGEGLVLGAIFGGLLGAAAQEARVQSAEQAYERRQAVQQQVPMNNFRRAMGACMSGRGYRVG